MLITIGNTYMYLTRKHIRKASHVISPSLVANMRLVAPVLTQLECHTNSPPILEPIIGLIFAAGLSGKDLFQLARGNVMVIPCSLSDLRLMRFYYLPTHFFGEIASS